MYSSAIDIIMMSPSSSYGSIAFSSNLTSSSSESNSIDDGDGSSTTSTVLRRRRNATESSRFFFTAYSANYSILFLLTLTTVIFFASSRRHQWYQGIPLLLRSSSKKKCKTLYLLRHAKSSWLDSSNIDDYDRQLSPQGRKLAHVVGKSLLKNKHVHVPDVILASPSVRTRETLDIVLAAAAWGRKFFDDESSKILYSKSWYDLSDEGYLNHLVHMLSYEEEEDINNEGTSDQGNTSDHGGSSIDANNTLPNHNIFSNVNTIMIVGHNPAIERLLNDLLTSPNDDKAKQEWHHYSPGHFYAVRFPTLERWSDLGAYIEEGRRGVVELHLPE